jgi:hypothetical protein
MTRSALPCLSAALLSAFIGVLSTAHTARAASPTFAVQADQISLRRPSSSQFMDGSPGVRFGFDQPARPATTSDSIRVGPGADEPTTIVDGSDPDTDRVVATALNVAMCVLYVASAIVVIKMMYGMADFLHSETPLARGAGR